MTYELAKALHVISLISWMAGLLYLPRLFVYHTQVEPGSTASETFKVMERKLLRYIMNPAMLAVWVIGLWLAVEYGFYQQGWFHIKVTLVLFLSAAHGMMAGYRKKFERDENTKSERFFRIFNEVPTLLMIAIVLVVYLKPFQG